MDGTLIHRKLAPSTLWCSLDRPRKDGMLSELWWKKSHTKFRILGETGIKSGPCDWKAVADDVMIFFKDLKILSFLFLFYLKSLVLEHIN